MSLRYLRVKNFAIFDEAEIHFGPGLNAITGESGSGKSLVLEALRLLTGGRAQGGVVRSGTGQALLEAVFDVDPEKVAEADAEGQVILSRQLSEGGKSLFRLNGQTVPAQMLKDLGRRLVEVVGQGEGSELLDTAYQRELLDRVAGNGDRVASRRASAAELRDIERQIAELGGDGASRERQRSLLAYEIREIEEAALEDGEEEELRSRRRLLSEREGLGVALGAGREALLGGARPGAYDLLARAIADLDRYASLTDALGTWRDEADGLLAQIQDLGQRLAALTEDLEADPRELEAVEARLLAIEDLKRKFGPSVSDVKAFLEASRTELVRLEGAEETLVNLDAQRIALSEELRRLTEDILARREETGPTFAEAVTAELREMGFEDPAFEVRMDGDQAAFWFRPNPGEPARPLAQIASGGEQSRVLLALKAFQTEGGAGVVVLDEVDQGLGGDTVRKVTERLRRLAGRCQVIAVTHQAVVAARADWHVGLEKSVESGRTRTVATRLTGEARVREIARMLAGSGDEAGIGHARILVQGDR